MAIGLGFVLIGLGGFSTYHASQKLQHEAEMQAVEQKGEMNAQILTLLVKNQELQQKVEEPPAPAAAPPGPAPTYFYRPPSPPPPVITHPEAAAPGSKDSPPRGAEATPEPVVEAPPVGEPPPGAAEPPAAEAPRPSEWHEPDSLEPGGLYLSGRQRTVIADTLRAHGRHTVSFESSYGDPVSRAFAAELAAAFAEADWPVRGIDEHRGLPLAAGVTVSAASFPPLPETRAVYEALLSAGIAVTQQLDPKQRTSETVVLVGAPL